MTQQDVGLHLAGCSAALAFAAVRWGLCESLLQLACVLHVTDSGSLSRDP